MYLWYITFANPPPPLTIETLATVNVETGPKFQKHQSGQTFREDVYELGGCGYVQDADITDGNVFLDKVEVNLDMLCALVLNEVGGEVDNADVITARYSASALKWEMMF
jgi:hypothetical protein